MTHTLITLLGRSPKGESGYRKTRYQFPDGTETDETAVLGLSLVERLKPDRFAVLGTAGSMWDYLVEYLDLGSREEACRLELQECVDGKYVGQDLLDRISPLLEERIDSGLRLRLIPYGVNETEQIEILHVLAGEVRAGESVTLDVTHAFRHLPMLVLVSALHLKVVKAVDIGAIYYGFYDPDTGMATVFDLKGLLHIVEWVKALNNFDKDADYGVFAKLLDVDTGRDSGQVLSDAAFRERTTRAGEARGLLRKFREDIENHHPGGAASLFVDTLMDKTQWVEEDKLYKRQRSLAANYLTSGDYLRASIYAFEAIITAQVQERGGNPDKFEDREAAKADFENQNRPENWNSYRQLRDLRNALAHGNPPSRRDIRQMMDSPECLRETLKCLIDTLLP